MTDEAREAAERWFPDDPLGPDAKIGFVAGFDAGVVEGKRQAREAVEGVAVAAADDWSPIRGGSRDALAAIDALEAT